MRLSDLQYLMHQLGPATPEIVAVIQEDIDSWQVVFDEDVSLQIQWIETTMRVLISCAIGQPPEDMREQVYASLLQANLLLSGVANLKLALSQPEEDVMLIGEYEITSSTLASLQDSLSGFLRFAAKFSSMVTDASAASSPVEAGFMSALHGHHT